MALWILDINMCCTSIFVADLGLVVRSLYKWLMAFVHCFAQVYEEALQSVPSGRMYELYAEFLIDNLEHDDDELLEFNDLAGEKGQISTLDQSAEALLTLYKRAKAAGVESETLAQGQAGLLLRLGNVDSAREALEVSCKENASTCGSARIWTVLLSLETKRTSVKTLDSSEQIAKHLKAAFKNASDDVKDLLQIVSNHANAPSHLS